MVQAQKYVTEREFHLLQILGDMAADWCVYSSSSQPSATEYPDTVIPSYHSDSLAFLVILY
jgi:hypothetical protein